MGEASLVFFDSDLSAKQISEDFPVAYAKITNDPTVPSIGGSLRLYKIHPALFAIVDGDESAFVKIDHLDWDHGCKRTDEELRKVGRKSQTVYESCDHGSVVSVLERLATERQ